MSDVNSYKSRYKGSEIDNAIGAIRSFNGILSEIKKTNLQQYDEINRLSEKIESYSPPVTSVNGEIGEVELRADAVMLSSDGVTSVQEAIDSLSDETGKLNNRVFDISPFNAATDDIYLNFIEKYQLRQNAWVDLSFVSTPQYPPQYYSTLADAVYDINQGIYAGLTTEDEAEAVIFESEGIAVLRLLKDVTISSTINFTNSVIFDLYGKTITNNVDSDIDKLITSTSSTDNPSVTLIFYDNKDGLINISFNSSLKQAIHVSNNFTGFYGVNIKADVLEQNIITDTIVYFDGCNMSDVYNCNMSISRNIAVAGDSHLEKVANLLSLDHYTKRVRCIACHDTSLHIDNSSFSSYSDLGAVCLDFWRSTDKLTHISIKNSSLHAEGYSVASLGVWIQPDLSSDFGDNFPPESSCIYEFVNIKITAIRGTKRTTGDNIEDGIDYSDYAMGIEKNASGVLLLDSCEIHGCYSGVEVIGTAYIKNCYLASPSHGGLYAAMNSRTYIVDTKFLYSDKPYDECIRNGSASAYFAYDSETWIDNCEFLNRYFAAKKGVVYNADGTTTSWKYAYVYISNSNISKDNPEWTNTARIDTDAILYVGEGMDPGSISNVTASYPSGIINYEDYKDEKFRYLAPDITMTSDEILNSKRLRDTMASNIAYEIFMKSGLGNKNNGKIITELFKSVIAGDFTAGGEDGYMSSDWSVNNPDAPGYVKNRTHYTVQSPSITWDGSTEGRDSFDASSIELGTFYKISDDVWTRYECNTATVSSKTDSFYVRRSELFYDESIGTVVQIGFGADYYIFIASAIAAADLTDVLGLTIPSAGLYAFVIDWDFTYPLTITPGEVVTKLPSKYLPDEALTIADITPESDFQSLLVTLDGDVFTCDYTDIDYEELKDIFENKEVELDIELTYGSTAGGLCNGRYRGRFTSTTDDNNYYSCSWTRTVLHNGENIEFVVFVAVDIGEKLMTAWAKTLKVEEGKTPIKGVDYYTEADKQEMVDLVLSAIPNAMGVDY